MTDNFSTTLRMPLDLAEAVTDFWHNERLMSRNEAICELLRRALQQDAKPAKEQRR